MERIRVHEAREGSGSLSGRQLFTARTTRIRRGRRRRAVTVVSATAGIAALGLIAVTVTRASGAENAARSASVTTPMKVGGWGRGGYPMVTTAGNGAAIGNSGAAPLTMVSQNGVTEATPSALADGNSFTVTWDNDGVTGTGAGAGATAPASTAAAPAATASTPPATASASTSPSP
jgi:hypothetical protein